VNGQNVSLPSWLGVSLRVGGVLIAGVMAFTTLQADVTATDVMANDNKDQIERHEERLDAMQMIQVEQMVILKSMKDTLEEVRDDVKEHKQGDE